MSDNSNITPEAVLKDVHFLKEAWANLVELDENEQDNNPSLIAGENVITNSGEATSLTIVQNVNQEADKENPNSEDQGFQLVTTREKNFEKAKIENQGNYSTRSKVSNPKPFK